MEAKKLKENLTWKNTEVIYYAGKEMDDGMTISIPLCKQASKYDDIILNCDVYKELTNFNEY